MDTQRQKSTLQQKSLHPAVSVQGVRFLYGKELALDDVSLELNNGEFLTIIGPNGGGKTTFLRLLLGFLSPAAGSIRIFGANPRENCHLIGYVPQFSTLQVGFPASVLETVLMGASHSSLRGGGWSHNLCAREKAKHLLEVLDLGHLASETVFSLSGGQRQRVLLARALMGRPEDESSPFLLLLDEPTASIDPLGKSCFYELLKKIQGQCTIVMVSHDLFIQSPYFDAVALVNKNLSILPDKKLNETALERVYGVHAPECPVGVLQSILSHDLSEE